MYNSNKKGFTLIELLVVVAIIGILSTIGLVALNGARGKARDAKRASDLRQYSLAYQSYYDSANTYVTGAASASQASAEPDLRTFFGANANYPEDPQGTAAATAGGACTLGIADVDCRLGGGWTNTVGTWYTVAYEANAAPIGFGIAAYFEAGAPGSAGAGMYVVREDGRFCKAAGAPTGC